MLLIYDRSNKLLLVGHFLVSSSSLGAVMGGGEWTPRTYLVVAKKSYYNVCQ